MMRYELHGLRAMLWKERRDSAESTLSRWAGTLMSTFIGVVVGYAFPEAVGFWTAWGIAAFMGVYTLPSAADAFAGERERGTLETLFTTPLSEGTLLLGKVLAMVRSSWLSGMAFLIAVVAGATVRAGGVPMAAWELLAAGAFALPVHTLLALVGTAISLGSTTVQQALRRVAALMFLLVMGPMTLVIGLTVVLPADTLRVVFDRLQALATFGMGRWLSILVILLLASNGMALWVSMKRFNRSRALLV